MLEVKGLSVQFGAVKALTDVSLSLPASQVGTVIGANGAGKSTLLSCISGLVPASDGEVRLGEHELTSKIPPYGRGALGIAHVLEGHRVFGDQSVEDNLLLGALKEVQKRSQRDAVYQRMQEQFDRFPVLADRRTQQAATLSGGERQMLGMAVALMSRPALLMLDEPSLGLAPKIVDDTYRLIEQLKAEGLTILLVEQVASLALSVADYGWVLRRGQVVSEGTPAELRRGGQLEEAYLGG